MTTNLNHRTELPDSRERSSAITNLKENAVVIAGAGTGKTTLLIDRAVHLLLGMRLPAESLVILTFTEKAAGEMKVRLAEKLRSLYHCLLLPDTDPKNRELLDEIIKSYRSSPAEIRGAISRVFENIDKAQIGTIHSFASHILRLYPLEAGVDPDFEVDEEDNFEELFAEEWGKWLDTELSADSAHRETWLDILSAVELEQIEALAKKMSGFSVPLENLAKKSTALKNMISRYTGEMSALLPRAVNGRNIDAQVKLLHKILSGLAEKEPSGFAKALGPSEKALLSKAVSKTKEWAKNERIRIEETRKFVLSLASVNDRILDSLAGLLVPFIKSFRTKYSEEGFASFDGLLVFARDLLKENVPVRNELKAAYNAILIDEFQDTDPLQAELLLFLAEKTGTAASSWDRIEFEPGKLFIVGDPKQSIYYFRGADISAFQAVRSMIKQQDGREYTLSTNFRSHSGIINMVNTVFSGLIRKKENIQAEYNPIFPNPASPREAVKPELILMKNEPGEEKSSLGSHQARELEARTIAGWISENCGKLEIYGKTLKSEPLRYRDIAIIMRSLPSVHVYLEELRNLDIPFVVEGEKSFYEAQEVVDFVNLLRAIENPEDKLALVGILRSPLGALTDREIYGLKCANLLDYRKSGDKGLSAVNPSVPKLYRILDMLHGRTGRLSINKLLDEILDKTYIMEIGAYSYHKEQALANIMKFRRVANEVADKGVTTLQGLVRIMQEHIEQGMDEGEGPLSDDTFNAVKVLSVHKSKGLEYPVVFLPNLHGGKGDSRPDEPSVISDWSSGTVGISIPKAKIRNSGMVILENEKKKREAEEENRILYVAATRAKDRLILLGNETGEGKPCALNKIRAFSVLNDPSSPHPRNTGVLDISCRSYSDIKPARAARACRIEKKATTDWTKIIAAGRRRAENARGILNTPLFLSPSALLREQEKAYFRNPEESSPFNAGALTGIICHRILEKWDYDGASLDGLIKTVFAGEISNYPHPDREKILSSVTAHLKNFARSAEYNKIKESRILGREIPFIMPYEGAVMRGVIDLIYKDGENTVIADFKTGKGGDPGKYGIQAEIYRAAVRNILKIRDAEVKFIFL